MNTTTTAQSTSPKTTTAPVVKEIKQTAVADRLHKLSKSASEDKDLKFRGKQRQIVFEVLKESGHKTMTIAQIAKVAATKGLTAVGGVEPSVQYHLHHLTKDGFVTITNPTFELEPIPADAKSSN